MTREAGLAEVRVLEDAISRLGRFLADYKQ